MSLGQLLLWIKTNEAFLEALEEKIVGASTQDFKDFNWEALRRDLVAEFGITATDGHYADNLKAIYNWRK